MIKYVVLACTIMAFVLVLYGIIYATIVDRCLKVCGDSATIEVKRLLTLPKDVKCICSNQSYPVKSYTLGLASFPWKWLCDFQFTEYSDGRVEVKKLSCIEFDKELAETLTERFLR